MERLTDEQRTAFMNHNKNCSYRHFKTLLPLGRTFRVLRAVTNREERSRKRKQIIHSIEYRNKDLQNTWKNLNL